MTELERDLATEVEELTQKIELMFEEITRLRFEHAQLLTAITEDVAREGAHRAAEGRAGLALSGCEVPEAARARMVNMHRRAT